MAGRFTKIPQNLFETMQMDAGVLLNTFDPETPTAPADADIITATTGGVNVVCQPTYSDFGEDVDNCPNNTKELKHLDGWNCSLSTTALTTDANTIKMALGAADLEDGTVTPRSKLEQTDFKNAIWWVGDLAGGGMAAVKLINALSTDGFSMQTGKNAKGQITLTIGGHVSITDQDVVPMEFYVSTDDEEKNP